MARPRKVVKPQRRTRGTGSLSVSSDGTIRARLPARLDPARRAREFPPGHLAEATAWLDAALNETSNNKQNNLIPPATVTLGDWLTIWHARYVAPITAPGTARHYSWLLRQLAPLYGLPLAEIRPSALQGIVATFSARVGPATAQQAAGVWRRCLEAAVDDELLTRNPARRLALPKTPPRSARRHVTPKEAAVLRAAIVGHRFEAAYALLLGCGLRIGEVLGLSWANVDLAARRAWIQWQWTGSAWRDLPKGRRARWIDLPAAVVSALIRHRNAQPEGSVLVMQSPFRRKRTGEVQPWAAFTVSIDLHTIVAELGLEPASPHAFRHGLSAYLLNSGVPASDVAATLGHSSPDITLRSYSHPSGDPETINRAVDGYLGGDMGESATHHSESG